MLSKFDLAKRGADNLLPFFPLVSECEPLDGTYLRSCYAADFHEWPSAENVIPRSFLTEFVGLRWVGPSSVSLYDHALVSD